MPYFLVKKFTKMRKALENNKEVWYNVYNWYVKNNMAKFQGGFHMLKKLSTVPFNGTKEQEAQLKAIIEENKCDKSRLMAVMQEAQGIYGYLPMEVQNMIAEGMEVPLEKVYGVSTFYAQFSHVTGGQRIVLILDEFDKILERIAGDSAAQAHFFKQLDAILTNVELQKYVRFIFCGSNYLLRCSMDGGVMHQVFQRADTIEVGHLSEADMRTMLIKPTLESGVTFNFTEEALSYFYRIFQGSIWPVRLIGQKIVDELRKIGRSTVYPSDIYEYVHYVLDPKDKCQQFTEGCEQNERRVLRAIHYYTTHQNASVSIAEIQDRLQANGDRLDPASLCTSLSLLRQLKLVEEDNTSTSGKRYRFAGELYRIFFSVLFDSEYANDTLPYDDMIFLRDEKEDLLIQGENAHGQSAAFAGLLLLDDEDDE